MSFTDGGLVEPVILLLCVLGILALALRGTIAFARAFTAQRRLASAEYRKTLDRCTAYRRELVQARDALTGVIADPSVSASTRDRALEAYASTNVTLAKGSL